MLNKQQWLAVVCRLKIYRRLSVIYQVVSSHGKMLSIIIQLLSSKKLGEDPVIL